MNRWLGLLSLLWCVPASVAAQDTTAAARDTTTIAARPAPTVTLSLDQALQQARANSPTYRQTLNDAGPAKWGVRNAYGNFLPQLNVSSDLGYFGSGESNVGGGFIQPTSAFLTSGYNLGVFWQLDGRVLSGPGQQKALKRATDEDISGASITLRAEIETQYLNTLQATAQVGWRGNRSPATPTFSRWRRRDTRWDRPRCSTSVRRRSRRARAMWRSCGRSKRKMRPSSTWFGGWEWSLPRQSNRSGSATPFR